MAVRSEKQRILEPQGSVAVMVALAMVVLAGMATLAVDYGFLEYKRSQLQNAADAAALAGTNVLLQYGGNHTAVTNVAVTYGQDNLSDSDAKDLAIRNSDVTYPDASSVEATVGRTASRGNPVEMFLGRILGWNTQDITARGKAALSCSKSSQCLKPFMPPAKPNGNDIPGYTNADIGTQVTLKNGANDKNVVSSHYQPINYPPAVYAAGGTGDPQSGGSTYRDNIAGCSGSNATTVSIGDQLRVETGNMVGPTQQGIQDLIDQDPGAYWDTATNSIRGSSSADAMDSPRVALIPFYDPRDVQKPGSQNLKIYQLGAVFITGVTGSGDVTGYFIKTMAVGGARQTGCDPNNAFALFNAGLVR